MANELKYVANLGNQLPMNPCISSFFENNVNDKGVCTPTNDEKYLFATVTNPYRNMLVGSNSGVNKVHQLSPTTGVDSGTITGLIGTNASHAVYASDFKRYYVSTNAGVEVYNAETQTIVTSISIAGGTGFMCYVSSVQKLYVRGVTDDANIYIINCNTNTISNTIASYGGGVAYCSSTNRVWSCNVARDTIVEINPLTETNTGTTLLLSAKIDGLGYISENNKLYVGKGDNSADGVCKVYVVNPTAATLTTTINVTSLGLISDVVNFKYILSKVYISIGFGSSAGGTILVLNPTTDAVSDAINFSAYVYDMDYVASTGKLAVSEFGNSRVYFIDPTVTYNSAYADSVTYNYPYTSVSNCTFLSINPNTTTQSATVNLFDVNSSLSSGVTVTMAGAVSYAQLVQSLVGSPIVLKSFAIYNTANNTTQLGQNISFNIINNIGTTMTYILFPVLSPWQKQSAIEGLDPENFVLNGQNYIQYVVLAGQTMTFVFKMRDLSFEDYMETAKAIEVDKKRNPCLVEVRYVCDEIKTVEQQLFNNNNYCK